MNYNYYSIDLYVIYLISNDKASHYPKYITIKIYVLKSVFD